MSGRIWTPRDDQRRVLEWLAPRDRAAVWAPTGSGKTAITATWLAQKMDDCVVSRVLIVAPKLVAQHGWPLQMQLWSHVQHLSPEVRVIGFDDLGLTKDKRGPLRFADKRATKKRLQALPGRIHVASWDAFPWMAKAFGANWPYDCVVFDEASFLRDQQSERGKAARHVVHRSGVVEHVLELTATPAANHQEAVFAQLDLVRPGLLGQTLTEFRETYCIPESKNWQTGQVYRWGVAPAMQAVFDAKCAEVAISVPSSLGVPMVEVEQWVDLPGSARDAYQELQRDLVWGPVSAGSAGVLHSKLRQMSTGFVYDDQEKPVDLHTAKTDRLAELVDSIDEPVILAYEFIEELARLKALFGDQLADIRQNGARAVFEAGKAKVLALHPQSAGHGVDGLQHVCRHLIWTTVPQDRELYDQTNGRVHRHETRADTVYVHALIARGTVEQRVWEEVLPGKLTVQDLLLQAARKA